MGENVSKKCFVVPGVYGNINPGKKCFPRALQKGSVVIQRLCQIQALGGSVFSSQSIYTLSRYVLILIAPHHPFFFHFIVATDERNWLGFYPALANRNCNRLYM